jgi:hypothetical protein
MLGRTQWESPVHTALAAAAGNWTATAPDDAGAWDSAPVAAEEMLALGGLTDTFATVAVMADLAAVVYIGSPTDPDPSVEDYLLRGNRKLLVVAAQAVPSQWVWVGPVDYPFNVDSQPQRHVGFHTHTRGSQIRGSVVLDEAAMRDLREPLRSVAAPLRVVPAHTNELERALITEATGSMIIERDRIPSGFVELPRSSSVTDLAPLWYGLVDAREVLPSFNEAASVWLAFRPSDDYQGSLRNTLEVFEELGLDLTHLRSQREPDDVFGPRPHHFFTAFGCQNVGVLDALRRKLSRRKVEHRVLAIIPGAEFSPKPSGLSPQWH